MFVICYDETKCKLSFTIFFFGNSTKKNPQIEVVSALNRQNVNKLSRFFAYNIWRKKSSNWRLICTELPRKQTFTNFSRYFPTWKKEKKYFKKCNIFTMFFLRFLRTWTWRFFLYLSYDWSVPDDKYRRSGSEYLSLSRMTDSINRGWNCSSWNVSGFDPSFPQISSGFLLFDGIG